MADSYHPYGTLYCPIHGTQTNEFKPRPQGDWKFGTCAIKAENRRAFVPYPPEMGMSQEQGYLAISYCGFPLFDRQEKSDNYKKWYNEYNGITQPKK